MDSSTISNDGAEHFKDGECLEDDTCAYSDVDEEPEEPDFATKNPSLVPLITSNDVPQPAQLTVLWEIRREHDVAISKVETDIADVESALEVLEARRDTLLREQEVLYSEQDQCLALMSPIRRLPPEILGEIFLYFTPILCTDESRSSTPDPPTTEIPWDLAQVSQYWRRVAVSLRPLWSVFDFCHGRRRFYLEEYTSRNQEWFEEALEAAEKERVQLAYEAEAAEQLGEVRLPDDEDDWCTLDERALVQKNETLDWLKASENEETRREQTVASLSLGLCLQRSNQGPFSARLVFDKSPHTMVFDTLSQCSRRSIHLVFINIPSRLLQKFSQSHADYVQLRRLELAYTTEFAKFNSTLLPVWPPALTELALTKVDFVAEDGIPWVHLIKYREKDCKWPPGDRRWAEYRQLTNVIDLCIEFAPDTTRSDGPHNLVLLPKLKHAGFVFANDQAIFQYFVMPLLNSLSYDHREFRWGSDVTTRGMIPLPRSLSHLTTLRIYIRLARYGVQSCPSWRFVNALRAPKLTELAVDIGRLECDLIPRLLSFEGGVPLGRNLAVLEVGHFSLDTRKILELLEARFHSPADGVESETVPARMRKLTLYDPTNSTLEAAVKVFQDEGFDIAVQGKSGSGPGIVDYEQTPSDSDSDPGLGSWF
ncbi:hypothetical protein C8R46DRAFT_1227837 [Mycena filopes]|nr:hypothetical protein C8R46DRAFT_1227837 [Mycena filopes]